MTKSTALLCFWLFLFQESLAFTTSRIHENPNNKYWTSCHRHRHTAVRHSLPTDHASRRTTLQHLLGGILLGSVAVTPAAKAQEEATTSSKRPTVTDRIYIDIKGLPIPEGALAANNRVVLGLYGTVAPDSTQKLKALSSTQGLQAPCKPKEERALQREQLEANKVYNSCIENEDRGVNYEYAQIWRIRKDDRIDLGSVAGKFVARQYPNWQEPTQQQASIPIQPGSVTVRRGDTSGFGFCIHLQPPPTLEDDLIVVGQVVDGMEVVEQLNQIPVITSAKVNYMGLVGGPTQKDAPTRSCRYGGPMYCNENKPLTKLTIVNSGIL